MAHSTPTQNRRLKLLAAIAGSALALSAVVTTTIVTSQQNAVAAPAVAPTSTTPLQLNANDHVIFLGSAIADRMQHSGFFEAMVQAGHAKDQLVFRDLAVSGDEVGTWHRSENFGSRDEWLTKTNANVILAFYGFNESFKGPDGIPQFKKDLEKFLDDAEKQKFDGKSAPRVVLISPTAAERHRDPNFPDPAPINANLKLYVGAMAEIAKAKGVPFVDLFNPSQQLFAQAAAQGKSLTINGIYLSEEGDRQIAPILFKALFGLDAPANIDPKLLAAIHDKNEEWHSRYRTVDGYNVYGGRSRLSYPSGPNGPKISNNQIMQEEMTQRDVMTANREKRVWAIAAGGDLKVDDSNLPKVEQVKTNKPGPNPDGSYKFKSGEEAIADMTVPAHVKVNLFASEEKYPELVNPVQMAWDAKGRLWVSAWRNYPERTPTSKQGDAIIILEDTDHDGKADKCTTFIGDLNCPTGFQFYKNGILLMEAPDLWYVPIEAGDKPGKPQRILMGLDSADSHHTTNSMCLEPGGATYLSDGVFHRTQVETAYGPVRNTDAAIYRFEPRTGKLDRYAAYGFANPHGRVFDYWGNDIITDATGNASYFAPAFSGRIDYPGKHPGMKQFWERPSRPCPGTGILSSRAWPDDFNGNFLNCNVIGIQGIFRVKVSEDGSGLKGETLENLVTSKDPNFRPSGVNVGPDGAVYFMDWQKPLIGHMQHHLRDPNRDHEHGRVYRMVYEGKQLLTPPKIDGQPVAALLDLLKTPENDVRTLAKIELDKHDPAEVIPAVKKWIAGLDKNDPAYEHNVLEGLWVHQWLNTVDVDLLKQELASKVPQVRAQAVRVLCYWRDRVPGATDLLKVAAADESPRVRLEAVRAASFFDGKDGKGAMEAAYEAYTKPQDYYLDYCLKETLKQLRNVVTDPVVPSDPKIAAALMKTMTDKQLLAADAKEPVLMARLERVTIEVNARNDALGALAKMHKRSVPAEFVEVIRGLDEKGGTGGGAAADLAKILPVFNSKDLAAVRGDLLKVATTAKQPGTRRVAWAAIVTNDGDPMKTWADAKTPAEQEGLIQGTGLLGDSSLREKLQPKLAALAVDAKAPANVRAAAIAGLPLTGAENAKANFKLLAKVLTDGPDRTAAARAIVQLPRDSWDKATGGPAAEAVLAWAGKVPEKDRTGQDFVETVKAGNDLAGLLPAADATKVRKSLRSLSVAVFVVRTVREQMRYDTPRLVVEAGKPFEVIMENDDFMPHNIVFVQPGTRQQVAEALQNDPPTKLDKKGRAYYNDKDKRIIDGCKLLEPGQKETIKITAPKKEGTYEYVCTFPGHWMVMWGTLVVTKDVDAYLQKNPEAPQQPAGAEGGHQHHHAAAN
jgi:glucose/arabinose dehydrogenase/azurin